MATPLTTRVVLGNPCGTTGTDACFDCQQCPNAPSDESFVLVRYEGERLHRHAVTGPEAERLMQAHGLSPWGKQYADLG